MRFLGNVQRLLEETRTTSTYKFALLLALADLSVERGDDSGASLSLSTDQIAAKFVIYYWQHTFPFESTTGKLILRQNTDRPPRVLTDLSRARREFGNSVGPPLGDRRLISRVEQTVRNMPLRRLQRIGKATFDFLYTYTAPGKEVELRPGVVFCFRRFHGLLQDLIRGAWLRFVRQLNAEQLGAEADLGQFLFGSRRSDLVAARRALEDVGPWRCFFCGRELAAKSAQVDHFIPWSRYPTDLGHNLVLTDAQCNAAKADRLPSATHLRKWSRRNWDLGAELERSFAQRGVFHNLKVTIRIAVWAYAQTEAAEGLTWDRADRMVPLDPPWRQLLSPTA